MNYDVNFVIFFADMEKWEARLPASTVLQSNPSLEPQSWVKKIFTFTQRYQTTNPPIDGD